MYCSGAHKTVSPHSDPLSYDYYLSIGSFPPLNCASSLSRFFISSIFDCVMRIQNIYNVLYTLYVMCVCVCLYSACSVIVQCAICDMLRGLFVVINWNIYNTYTTILFLFFFLLLRFIRQISAQLQHCSWMDRSH